MEHCPDHENRSERLVQVESCVKNLKYNWQSGKDKMNNENSKIWDSIDSKLSSKVFFSIIWTTISILVIVVGFQWGMLMDINHKVDEIAVKQGVIMGELKSIGK